MTDWATVVREHGPMAIETAWRILGDSSDTEDAVQDAFLDALRIGRQRTVRNWGGLLRHLASRRALDLLRKRKRRATVGLEAGCPAPRSSHPETLAIAAERTAVLRQALARLPAREAEVFSLRYFGDLSNSEIAATLSITIGAVGVALHKARTRLQALIPS